MNYLIGNDSASPIDYLQHFMYSSSSIFTYTGSDLTKIFICFFTVEVDLQFFIA